MQKTFDQLAVANKVYPLGAGIWLRLHPEDRIKSPYTSWQFDATTTRMPEFTAPGIGRENNTVTIDAESADNASGVLYALGGSGGGLTLFMDKGQLVYEYNMMIIERYVARSANRIPAGKRRIEVTTTIGKRPAAVARGGRAEGRRPGSGADHREDAPCPPHFPPARPSTSAWISARRCRSITSTGARSASTARSGKSPSGSTEHDGTPTEVVTALLHADTALPQAATLREGFMNNGYGKTTRAVRSARIAGAALAAGVLLAGNGAAWAQQPAAPAAAPAPAAAAASAAVVNAKAIDRLNAMGAHLRSLKAFTVNADVTVEEVLDSGQKVENALTVEIAARMPDKLRVSTTSAERSRKVYYDGKSVTIFGQKLELLRLVRRARHDRAKRWTSQPRSTASKCRLPTCS